MSPNLLFLSPPIKSQLWKTSELSVIMAEDRTVLHIPHVLTGFLGPLLPLVVTSASSSWTCMDLWLPQTTEHSRSDTMWVLTLDEKYTMWRGFPGGPVVETPSIRDVGSTPAQRTKILHAVRNGQKIRRIIIKNPNQKTNIYIYHVPLPFSLGTLSLRIQLLFYESLNRSVQRDQMERPCRGAVNSWLRCPLRTKD